MERLVEIKTEQFSAVVPRFLSLNMFSVLTIMSLTFDPGRQFQKTVELFRDNLSPDKQIEFDDLSLEEVLPVMTAWVVVDKEDLNE